jgi:hypothetical protein
MNRNYIEQLLEQLSLYGISLFNKSTNVYTLRNFAKDENRRLIPYTPLKQGHINPHVKDDPKVLWEHSQNYFQVMDQLKLERGTPPTETEYLNRDMASLYNQFVSEVGQNPRNYFLQSNTRIDYSPPKHEVYYVEKMIKELNCHYAKQEKHISDLMGYCQDAADLEKKIELLENSHHFTDYTEIVSKLLPIFEKFDLEKLENLTLFVHHYEKFSLVLFEPQLIGILGGILFFKYMLPLHKEGVFSHIMNDLYSKVQELKRNPLPNNSLKNYWVKLIRNINSFKDFTAFTIPAVIKKIINYIIPKNKNFAVKTVSLRVFENEILRRNPTLNKEAISKTCVEIKQKYSLRKILHKLTKLFNYKKK